MKLPVFFILLLTIGGCSGIPRDQEGTLKRIAETREVRVGLVASVERSLHFPRLATLVRRAAAAGGGAPRVERATAEELLLRLEAGELDMVVGEFDRSSPWVQRIHLLPKMAERSVGDSSLEATAAARNGENGWIMLLEREARTLSVTS